MGNYKLWKAMGRTLEEYNKKANADRNVSATILNSALQTLLHTSYDVAELLDTLKKNAEECWGYSPARKFMRIPKDVWDEAWAKAKKGGG